MMEIKTLEKTSLAQITQTFNEAFSDYFIRLQFTEQAMAAKIKSEGIRLSLSAGAFEKGQLVGFILHGFDRVDGIPTIYNAGTGVVPSFRGKRITQALYSYLIPYLKNKGVHHHVLEVIDTNLPAMHIYRKTGFVTQRKLAAYKSTRTINANEAFIIKKIDAIDQATENISMQPAWQNSTASIQRNKEDHCLLGVFKGQQLIAYAVYSPAAGRVKQCFVHAANRRQGIGRALFCYMQQHSGTKELVLANIDEGATEVVAFLGALGFQKLLGLYEMHLAVNDAIH